jgi:lipopolysaccharide export system permease protein
VKILDRYVLREFVTFTSMGVSALVVIWILVDVFEKLDSFIDHSASLKDILLYYLYGLPMVLVLILPTSLLLGCLLALGYLAKHKEIVAMRSLGLSLMRIYTSILVFSVLISIVSFGLGGFAAPHSSAKQQDLWDYEIMNRIRPTISQRTNVHYLGKGGRVYLIKTYDINAKKMRDVVVQDFSGGTLVKRIDARQCVWDGDKWVFTAGYVRKFGPEGETAESFAARSFPEITERPEDFAKVERTTAEMNIIQFARYTKRVAQSGGNTQKLDVELQTKIAFPFANLIVVLIGVSLAGAVNRGGVAIGSGLALTISFLYYGFIRAGEALGNSGTLPPLVAAWIGNAFFLVLGLVLLKRAQR